MRKTAEHKPSRRKTEGDGKDREKIKESRKAIRFEATLLVVKRRGIVRLPEKSSKMLSSRGQVAVQGTINGHPFQTVIEPDGDFGHWINIDARLQKRSEVVLGDKISIELQPSETWPEPKIPSDLGEALANAPLKIQELWNEITPMARWEWVRWINATRNPNTRQKRIAVSISKMESGKRRPCCFNLSSCTDPELSKGGKLVVG